MDYSDEEKHALELRRERSNKISKIMGDYLLKGYKMLSTSCNKCGTILMRDRKQNDYCVACNDIDGLTSVNASHDTIQRATQESAMYLDNEVTACTNGQMPADCSKEGAFSETDEYRCVIKEVERAVLTKMQWACAQLYHSKLEGSFRLLELIDKCNEMLGKLKQ